MSLVEFDAETNAACLLLRYPDMDTDEGDVTVSTISNRLVILMSFERQLLLTYHRAPILQLETFRDGWSCGSFSSASVETLLLEIVRCISGTYEEASRVVQVELTVVEDMSESDEVDKVRHLHMIHKQASIFERCALSTMTALEQLPGRVDDETCVAASNMQVACGLFRTAHGLLDETKHSSHSSLKMVMATTQFRSNVNFRLFTRIRVLTLPVAVATSWYGMNFEAMEELRNPNGYRGFMAVAVFSAVFIYVAVFYGVQMYDYLLARCCRSNNNAAKVERRKSKATALKMKTDR
jgi:Mg2+ and Co2+ transporter CorA